MEGIMIGESEGGGHVGRVNLPMSFAISGGGAVQMPLEEV